METELEMLDFGEMNYFFGMKIHQCDAKISITKKKKMF